MNVSNRQQVSIGLTVKSCFLILFTINVFLADTGPLQLQGYSISTVYTDSLMLQHQGICSHRIE